MRNIILLFVCFILTGCMSLLEDPTPEVESAANIPVMKRRFVSLRQVRNGMTKSEVASVVGYKVVVGYELIDLNKEQYKPVTLENPYRSEVMQKNGKRYDIDYYLVGIQEPDDKVSDDELVPLVFQKDKLIGQGWEYYNNKIK
ncbi:MAG: hypothetical protein KAR05_01565 [Candidatus Omnitrophica bacterium]|nr:hypothetical protein [Candidatus Omnitrophota bacterium]